MTTPHPDGPLSATDPRLSEWLDDRLPAAEAAEVARLVAASPELTRLVADLRCQKAWLAGLPATPPPTGFVQDVLAALDAAGDAGGTAAAVEAEWRRIERERLEEEIAEAREDAVQPAGEPLRQRWPWLALAGALAAGLLVAVVINKPSGLGHRQVALVEKRSAQDEGTGPAGRGDRLAGKVAETRDALALDGAPTEVKDNKTDARVREDRALNRKPVDRESGVLRGADDRTAEKASDKLKAFAGSSFQEEAKGRGRPREAGLESAESLEMVAGSPPAPRRSAPEKAQTVAGKELKVAANSSPDDRVVTFRIRRQEDRRRLEGLLAGGGLSVDKPTQEQAAPPGRPYTMAPKGGVAGGGGGGGGRAQGSAAPVETQAGEPSKPGQQGWSAAPLGSVDDRLAEAQNATAPAAPASEQRAAPGDYRVERLAIVGTPQAIEALVADLEASERQVAAGKVRADGSPAAKAPAQANSAAPKVDASRAREREDAGEPLASGRPSATRASPTMPADAGKAAGFGLSNRSESNPPKAAAAPAATVRLWIEILDETALPAVEGAEAGP
jgi:hypothetical protein